MRTECLGCKTVADVPAETTAAASLVRITCGVCKAKRIANRLPDPGEIDLVAEARRIFAGDLVEPGPIVPDRPSLEELGILPPGVRPREETVVPPRAPDGRLEAGMAASDQAGGRWTDDEILAVRTAILAVADRLEEFTADDVWTELGDGFPVTKGLAGRLNAASKAGVIEATGRVTASQRTDDHGHGQRLGIWRSLRFAGAPVPAVDPLPTRAASAEA